MLPTNTILPVGARSGGIIEDRQCWGEEIMGFDLLEGEVVGTRRGKF